MTAGLTSLRWPSQSPDVCVMTASHYAVRLVGRAQLARFDRVVYFAPIDNPFEGGPGGSATMRAARRLIRGTRR